MHGLGRADEPDADARADGDVRQVRDPAEGSRGRGVVVLGVAVVLEGVGGSALGLAADGGELGNGGGVDVGVESDREVRREVRGHRAEDVHRLPPGLGRVRDVPVRRARAVQVHGAERGDAERVQRARGVAGVEPRAHGRERRARIRRRELRARDDAIGLALRHRAHPRRAPALDPAPAKRGGGRAASVAGGRRSGSAGWRGGRSHRAGVASNARSRQSRAESGTNVLVG